MPNYGRSGRCLTCKRRRVKCDEARPACSPCQRLELICGGYDKEYAFKDENRKFTTRKISSRHQALAQNSVQTPEASRSLLTGANVAVPFFLVHYAGMGRSLAIGRGFYETLIPVYSSQPQNSPLSLAVAAVAARFFSLWRHQELRHASATYNQAVVSLRSALEQPKARRGTATLLAVLALHLYESISAVFDNREVAPVHHYGALSLLPIVPSDSLDGVVSSYVEGFVLHTEISSALRQKRSMHPIASSYVNSANPSSFVPGNLSSVLDAIGASVAELQADYVHEMPSCREEDPLLEELCLAWIDRARQIEKHLQDWAQGVPDYWRPRRLLSGRDFCPSIVSYRQACDIYPSCQIATLWNFWRFHRLLLFKIVTGALSFVSALAPSMGPIPSLAQTESIQELVDDVCYSIPFYLGNRSKPLSLDDFSDQRMLFPSYHLLKPGDERISSSYPRHDDIALSKDEHQRHLVAYGAWHVVGPLSNLLTLVSDDHGGRLVASCIRLGQLDWIQKQFMRVSTLIRLPAPRCSPEETDCCTAHSPEDADSMGSAAETIAKQVRKGSIFMSGP